MESYIVDYINENEFKKLEYSLKKYNMLAYKKLYFECYPELKKGNFLGEVTSINKENDSKSYQLELPTDKMFEKVHGIVKLHYIVYEDKKIIVFDKITPKNILTEGHQSELMAYKGVMISRKETDKDIFKINLLNMIGK